MTESVKSSLFSNDGLATAAELLALGVSRDQLRRWARTGQVTAIAHGVYSPTAWLGRVADDPRRMHALAAAAVIRRNPGLVASHESAAYLHGLDLLLPGGTSAPQLTLTRRNQAPGHALVRGALIRVAAVPDGHVTELFGLPVTTVPRTVMDMARTTGFMEGVVAADSALRSHAAIKVEFAVVLESRARAQLARDERFHDAGWQTFHFTWREIYHDRSRPSTGCDGPSPGGGVRPRPGRCGTRSGSRSGP